MPSSFIRHRYLNRRVLICVFLGFSSGLPLSVLLSLMQAWLAQSHLDIKTLGLFSLATFPYIWKFLWSPFMDCYHFNWLGRRRDWMALTQILLLITIGTLGMFDPRTQLVWIALTTAMIAFLSASQDVVIDAYRREMLAEDEQGLGNAVHVNAYKMSSLVPGALSLILADLTSWHNVFWITATFMLPGLLCTLLIQEPKVYGRPPSSLYEATVLPLHEFITRKGWKQALWVLGFIFFYKLGDSMATALATKFYLELGFSMTQIGTVAKATGLWASIVGGLVGGIWMVKIGIYRGLWIFGVAQALAILGFAWLASAPSHLIALAVVIGMEAFSVGLGTTAFVAYIAQTTDPRYTATQFALFTSLAAVPRTFINASVGFVISETGWFYFFILCFILTLPGLFMLPKIAPWRSATKKIEGVS